MNVLLVSPQTPDTFWSFKHVLRFVSKKSTFPPLGLLTVAAMLPRAWPLKLVDLNVTRLREEDLRWADVVMISAMLVHEASVREVVARCAALGKRVVAGGPLFTTGHEAFPEIQHFVLGEAEELMPQLVTDLQSGQLQRVYQATNRPSMALIITTSARRKSSSRNRVTFRSTSLRSHSRGNMAATVRRPSGGKVDFLETNLSTCLKLQNVSGDCGLTSRTFMIGNSG